MAKDTFLKRTGKAIAAKEADLKRRSVDKKSPAKKPAGYMETMETLTGRKAKDISAPKKKDPGQDYRDALETLSGRKAKDISAPKKRNPKDYKPLPSGGAIKKKADPKPTPKKKDKEGDVPQIVRNMREVDNRLKAGVRSDEAWAKTDHEMEYWLGRAGANESLKEYKDGAPKRKAERQKARDDYDKKKGGR